MTMVIKSGSTTFWINMETDLNLNYCLHRLPTHNKSSLIRHLIKTKAEELWAEAKKVEEEAASEEEQQKAQEEAQAAQLQANPQSEITPAIATPPPAPTPPRPAIATPPPPPPPTTTNKGWSIPPRHRSHWAR
jgi:hypothetical protein